MLKSEHWSILVTFYIVPPIPFINIFSPTISLGDKMNNNGSLCATQLNFCHWVDWWQWFVISPPEQFPKMKLWKRIRLKHGTWSVPTEQLHTIMDRSLVCSVKTITTAAETCPIYIRAYSVLVIGDEWRFLPFSLMTLSNFITFILIWPILTIRDSLWT